jgi:hypothetical protein
MSGDERVCAACKDGICWRIIEARMVDSAQLEYDLQLVSETVWMEDQCLAFP